MIRLSIVLPCYNEGETVNRLVAGYREILADRDDVELILVDNGSTDGTSERIAEEVAREAGSNIRAVSVPVNRGYGHGILCGLNAARGTFVAWSHADLQYLPSDAIRLLDAVMAHPRPETCFGKGHRVNDRGMAAIPTKLQSLLSRLILGCRLEEINAQPKLFHRDLLTAFRHPPDGYELDIYAYYKAVLAGWETVSVDVVYLPRPTGQSKWAYSTVSRLRFMAQNLSYLIRLRLRREVV